MTVIAKLELNYNNWPKIRLSINAYQYKLKAANTGNQDQAYHIVL